MSLTGPHTEEVSLTALLRSNILANLLNNSKLQYSICITTVYYYGRIRPPGIIDSGKIIPKIHDTRDDHCIIKDLNGMFPDFPKTQLSAGPPLGRTYAAPAVCWGGDATPPPLFGFGKVRICCIRVHQLKGQFSRYV